MRVYPGVAWEQAMKREEILLRAYSKQIRWIEAADILGMSYRHLQRVRFSILFNAQGEAIYSKHEKFKIDVLVAEIEKLY